MTPFDFALLAGDRPPRSRDQAVVGLVYALTEERLSSAVRPALAAIFPFACHP